MSRDDAAALPEHLADLVITGATKQSTVLQLGRRVPTTTKDSRVPVLSTDVEAYWVGADSGLKQTSSAVFTNESLTAEEIAVVVPVPDSVAEDSDYDLWAAVQPLISRALARRLDAAVLFGTNKPASWGNSLFEDATAVGNTITEQTQSDDQVSDVLLAAQKVAESGYAPTGTITKIGWQYGVAADRTTALVANPAGADTPFAATLAGLGMYYDPLYFEPSNATALVADWTNVLIGIRRDVTLERFRDGVISDDTGKVVLNLLQQDTSAIRATMRVGFLLSKPVNDSGLDADHRSPAAVVQPLSDDSSSSSSSSSSGS